MDESLQVLDTRLRGLICSLDAEGTQESRPGKWAIQQVVEHLILTYSSTTALIESRLEKGRPTQARPTFSQHCKRFLVVDLRYFPRGISAPEAVVPPADADPQSGEQIASRFTTHLASMDAALQRAAARFDGRLPIASHRLLGPFSADQWRRFHVVHGMHHLKQIRAIRSVTSS